MTNKINHRMKMCENCAFKKDSQEMSDPELKEYLIGECFHRVFYCHETMFNKKPENGKSKGEFDPSRKPDGSPACGEDHQVCAGFIKFYGEDFGINGDVIK